MKFNSPKSSRVYVEAVKDILGSSDKVGHAALKDRLDKVDIAITLAPPTSSTKGMEGLAKLLRKQLTEVVAGKGSEQDLAGRLKGIEEAIVAAAFSGSTTYGHKLNVQRLKAEKQKQKREEDEVFKDRERINKELAAHLKEVTERLRITPDAEGLKKLQGDLIGSLKSLKNGDLGKFLKLQAQRADLAKNYGLNDGAIKQLDKISEFVIGRLDKRAARNSKLLEYADKVGYRGLNLGNLARGVSAAKTGYDYARRYGGSAYRSVSGMARAASAALKSPAEVAEKRVQEDLFQRQVGALEGINRKLGKKSSGSGDMMGKLATLASGLLKGGLLGKILGLFSGGGMMGLLKKAIPALGIAGLAGSALGFAVTKLGPLALAGAAGWMLGKSFYNKYSVEIQDAIESMVEFSTRVLTHLENGMTWLREFIEDPRKKIREIGGKLKSAWDRSIFARVLGNPVEALSNFVSRTGAVASATAKRIGQAAAPHVATAKAALREGGSVAAAAVASGAASTATFAEKVSNSLKEGYNVRAGVDMKGLRPEVKGNFDRMVNEYQSRGGTTPINVNSAYRSPEKQAELYKQNPRLAAPPGRSSHNYGLAIDIDRAGANELDRMGLLGKYGFNRPINKEPWHLQVAGSASTLAKKGIYSSDGSVNQSTVGQNAASVESATRPIEMGAASASTPPVVEPPSQETSDSGHAGVRPVATAGSTTQVSASSIPKFSFRDPSMFLLNARALA